VSVAEAEREGQGAGWVETHRDEDLTFCLQVFRDRRLATVCLAHLRRAYAGARVLLVSDGDDDPRWADLAARHGAQYVRGRRLYAAAEGGAIIARLLDLFLERPTPWLLRIDTDTRVERRFRRLPGGSCVFGTLERRTFTHGERLDPPVVQGGCIGFTLEAARRLHDAGVFRSPGLRDWAATWADTRDARERAQGGRVSFDHLVRWGCRTLGIEARAHDEVLCVWRGRVTNPGLRYAVTHPHKPWWQAPRLWASVWLSRRRARGA
jgi:hypothetical protein